MLDEKSVKHLSTVPLLNDTVPRRINDLASYVKLELVTRLQKTRFALQMDESTDVDGLAILLVIVRYPYESSFEEDMLMCSPLPTNTIGIEFLFFERMSNEYRPSFVQWKWKSCDGIRNEPYTGHLLARGGLANKTCPYPASLVDTRDPRGVSITLAVLGRNRIYDVDRVSH
ncbi:Zinc finger BED domain-containing protein 5 [Eumeta japonica]|uniref:Zinc finger BED domain-containing protein 5 n=1 Tax=Eumeta variegata TaxID=151549 RepID=A0A4C1UCF5_EUMVA|nr:Zinc finger BED domain-containing protein 5 [Eumeta japonica]